MARISDEMTMRDIAEAINRGELDAEDPDVRAAVEQRFRAAHEAYREVLALTPPDFRPAKLKSIPTVADRLQALADDPEKLAEAKRAMGRIEDAIGSSEPGKSRFRKDGTAP